MKSRKAGSGTGSAWAQYTDELATALTTADTKAGEPQYVTTTFTVPADAAPEGALWLSFSDMGLVDDANGYIDDAVLVRSDSKPTLKTTAFTPTVDEGETASAYVELDGQPAAKEVSANKNATVDEVATALKPHRRTERLGREAEAGDRRIDQGGREARQDRTGKEAWRAEACRSAERLSKTGASVAGVAGAFALLLAAGVAVTVSRKRRA
ncbi:hypothetical protein [Bifidobacterium bifidum]|uniref:hypothetical protein n=1 Tax=Bifidobacterium bifidum TaxID=1681 RepID=UPI0020B280B1|nr:hypothetical protein [Bifidobacterium bifidum]